MVAAHTPLSARSLLPLTWSLVSEHESSVVVSVSIFADNSNALMTSEVEVLRDSWTHTWVDGPAVEETDLDLLCADVANWAMGGRAAMKVAA
jgi:hypothetical protein